MQCEGFRRHGGAFSFGPVTWVQCTNEATAVIEVKQDGKTNKFPACDVCQQECGERGIKVVSVTPVETAG
jgi:hypothetical protein